MDKDFIRIINDHRALIFKVCHLYCNDTEDRQDLFQEIIVQIWKSLGSFRQESKLSTWMYRVALNTAITHLRKEKRNVHSISIDGIDIPDDGEEEGREELFKQMFAAIDHLDRMDKSIILLYLEEKSYDEISEITGLSRTNVGVRINRIKTKLSNTLNV